MDYRLLDLTVAEFKAMKKAVQILCRAGMTRHQAVELLISARLDQRRVA